MAGIALTPELERAASRLVLALDFESTNEASRFIESIGAPPVIYKIGLELIYAGGLGLANALARDGRAVFLDAKLLDIGHTVERATASAAALGAAFLTVHASDAKTLKAAARGRGNAPLKLLGVTVLTNLDDADLREQGVLMLAADLVLRRARMARDAGFDGVVASPLEAAPLRAALGADALIVTPGIRPEGAVTDDQARHATPAAALAAGADYLVIGRPVTRNPNPAEALGRVLDAIAAA